MINSEFKEAGSQFLITGSRICAITIPYPTRAMLLPNNKAPMNRDGFL